MTIRVAVVDPLPMFARGLAATLGDDVQPVDIPDDVLGWLDQPHRAAVVLAVIDNNGWATLDEILRVRPDTVVVVIAARTDPETYARAVTAGAVGVLPRQAAAPLVRDVVRAAVDGRSVVPVDVLRALAGGFAGERPARPLSDEEVGWLRQLADGSTVAQLAQRVGYSERMMFRLLGALYGRLGEESRTRAIMRARDEGWI